MGSYGGLPPMVSIQNGKYKNTSKQGINETKDSSHGTTNKEQVNKNGKGTRSDTGKQSNQALPPKNIENAPKIDNGERRLEGLPHNPSGPNASFIADFIEKMNKEQKVHNLDRFDLRGGSETVVIVVQVHNRVDYLIHLIDSLRKSKNIENVLLIFSHDFYSPEMNKIVLQIDFCPVSDSSCSNQFITKSWCNLVINSLCVLSFHVVFIYLFLSLSFFYF